MYTMNKAVVRRVLLIGGLLGIIAIATLVVDRRGASASPLDQDTLFNKAVAAAQRSGLKGDPVAHASRQMALGEWLKFINAELGDGAIAAGLTPTTEVIAVAMRGEVVQNIPGLPEPGKEYPGKYSNITIVLNVQNGDVVWVGMYKDERDMPLTIP